VQQRRGVDELDHGRQVEALLAAITQRAADQQQQRRPQPLAAGGDDVARNLADQGRARIQPAGDDGVDAVHVVRNEGENRGSAGGMGGQGEKGRSWRIIGSGPPLPGGRRQPGV